VRVTFRCPSTWKGGLVERDGDLEGEHGGKEHGPIDPALREADPDDDDVGLVGGGGPAGTIDDDEFGDELDDRPDSAL
jgi:hypothetical protein